MSTTNHSQPRHIINAPGYYNLPLADYLADPCVKPSLSTQVVHTLFYESPSHAELRHPRLKGQKQDYSPRAEVGSAIHELFRGNADIVVYAPAEYDDWKKKAAQEFRDEARHAHKIPLLARQQMQIEIAANNARHAVDRLGIGKFERTLIWQVDGVWRRGRTDWLSDGPVQLGKDSFFRADVDLKSVASAERLAWLNTNVLPTSQALDIQMGMRHEGHAVLNDGHDFGMLWLLQEYEPPYAHSWIVVGAAMLAQAKIKIDHASRIFDRCLTSGVWPGFDETPLRAEPRTWAEMDILTRVDGAS